jgi:hypothetical protein
MTAGISTPRIPAIIPPATATCRDLINTLTAEGWTPATPKAPARPGYPGVTRTTVTSPGGTVLLVVTDYARGAHQEFDLHAAEGTGPAAPWQVTCDRGTPPAVILAAARAATAPPPEGSAPVARVLAANRFTITYEHDHDARLLEFRLTSPDGSRTAVNFPDEDPCATAWLIEGTTPDARCWMANTSSGTPAHVTTALALA